jgi:integrase
VNTPKPTATEAVIGSTHRASGHLSLRKRKGGDVWYVKFRLPDGRQVQRKLGPAWLTAGRSPAGWYTRKDAAGALRELLAAADRGTLAGVHKTGATFEDAAAEYLRYVEHVKQCDEATLRDYRSVINRYLLPHFGARAVEAITPFDVEAYRDDLLAEGRLSNRVIVRHLVVLHGVFRRAMRVYGLRSNPASAELVDRPPVRYTGEFVTLTPDEVRLLANHAADTQDAALYITAAFTGLRQGELLGLRWCDVDFSLQRLHVRQNWTNKRVKVPKSGRVRSAPMVDEVIAALDRLSRRGYLAEPSDVVFPSAQGGYGEEWSIRRRFYAALERAELPRIRFHDLRHCFATLAVQHWELPKVQGYLGHAHISTTMRYVHHAPAIEDAAKLSAALRGDSADKATPVAVTNGDR